MSGAKGKSGGKRSGAGRKKDPGEKMIIKIPVYKYIVDAKGGEDKVKQIMLEALITSETRL